MAYQPLRIPAHVGPLVRHVVRSALDPRLHDVRVMLLLPRVPTDSTCNFTIADALFGVIEGVSAVLWPRDSKPQEAFARCVREHYPSELQRANAVKINDAAAAVYAKFRNAGQHCLGLAISDVDTQGIRWPAKFGRRLRIFRDLPPPLTEAQLQEIETDAAWPALFGRPTLGDDGIELCLSVEPFYAGTRRLIESVMQDVDSLRHAEQFLARGSMPIGIRSGDAVTQSGATATAVTVMTPPIWPYDEN